MPLRATARSAPARRPPKYVQMLVLLPRRMCDDEVATIASTLIGRGRRSIDNADVGVEITRITLEMPSLDDIDRVRHRLYAMHRVTVWSAEYHLSDRE